MRRRSPGTARPRGAEAEAGPDAQAAKGERRRSGARRRPRRRRKGLVREETKALDSARTGAAGSIIGEGRSRQGLASGGGGCSV
jgi:hypothetical protein